MVDLVYCGMHPLTFISETPIHGYPDYTITTDGKIYHYGEQKKLIIKAGRSVKVRIGYKGVTRELGLATLLAQHFIPNPNNYSRIHFKDGNRHNCQAGNIEWVSDTVFAHHTLFKDKVSFNEGDKIIKPKRPKSPKRVKELRDPNSIEIVGYPGYYITPSAKVYKQDRLLKPENLNTSKSLVVGLTGNGKRKSLGLAKLVAITFMPNPKGFRHIIFIDRNNKNCSVNNLAWASGKEYNSYLRSFRKDHGAGKKADVIDPGRLAIPGYPGYYAATDGTIYCNDRILFKKRGRRRAPRVIVHNAEGVSKCVSVAKLVAAAFLPNPEALTEVAFKDGDYDNCRVGNLVWVSLSEFISLKRHRTGNVEELLDSVRTSKSKATVWIDPERVPVEGFPGYFVSPSGLIYRGNRQIKATAKGGKALIVRLQPPNCTPKRYRFMGLATIVAEHFVPNPKGHRHIIFKDRDNRNAHKNNIAWVDAETFAFYCGLYRFHTGRKKIVLERAEAIHLCTDENLKRYYMTLDEQWLDQAWKKIEANIRIHDWLLFRSDCYMYFIDRAKRFSITRNPLGIVLSCIKGLRTKLRQEISPDMPMGILLQTDESLRVRSKDYGFRSKWSGRSTFGENVQVHNSETFR